MTFVTFRPQMLGLSSRQWDGVWRNFGGALGKTAMSAAAQLSRLANTLSLVRQPVFLVEPLAEYQLGLSDGRQTGEREA
jgi:hypothetical protein